MRYVVYALLLTCFVLGSHVSHADTTAGPIVHHIDVAIALGTPRLEVRDQLQLPELQGADTAAGITFFLHRDFSPQVESGPYILEALPRTAQTSQDEQSHVPAVVKAYRVRPNDGTWGADRSLVLRYSTMLAQQPATATEVGPRGALHLSAVDGVTLGADSWWLPSFGSQLVTFRLTVDLPEAWDAVSQGRRTLYATRHGRRLVRWESPQATEDVYLIAAPFTVYRQAAGQHQTYAFLRQADAVLASTYLEATAHYLTLFARLFGPYPYYKFALVENVWESGYGMPSFTLLGPQVIRLPFIVHTSYAHEIAHNWWGNGVFINAEAGNWAEGLTTYLADHLLQEAQGMGTDYRRDALRRYRDYVREVGDFPLRDFRARHSPATQAIGYSKGMMVWHMLRLALGDRVFLDGLRQFYRAYQFQRASFTDLVQVFTAVSGRDLTSFFQPWIEGTGAPLLRLEVRPGVNGKGRIEVRQVQVGQSYRLTVLLAFTHADAATAELRQLVLDSSGSSIAGVDFSTLLRVDVDPYVDIFRRLETGELPPTVGQIFGAERLTIVVPTHDAVPLAAWHDLATAWQQHSAVTRVVNDSDLNALPTDQAVWLLGAGNRWRTALAEPLAVSGARVDDSRIVIGDSIFPRTDHGAVLVTRHSENPEFAIGWISTTNAAMLPALARKLPHYGKYSYLVFTGPEASNIAKGQWAGQASPLVWRAPGSHNVPMASLPQRVPLARFAE